MTKPRRKGPDMLTVARRRADVRAGEALRALREALERRGVSIVPPEVTHSLQAYTTDVREVYELAVDEAYDQGLDDGRKERAPDERDTVRPAAVDEHGIPVTQVWDDETRSGWRRRS